MGTEIASLFARIGADVSGLTNGLASARSALTGAGQSMQSAGTALTLGLTLPLVGLGTAAAKAATDLDAQMRNIQSISKGTDADIAALSARFVQMSTDLTVTRDSATELAAGFYQIQSSGFAGADAMTILEVSTKAASAGLTNTETAAKAILATLNAYGMEATEAARVSDVLFKSVDIGVFSFEEIAGAIGDTLGSAAAANVPIEELAAAFATMTKAGINANETATSLNQLMLSYISPSDGAKEAAAALGIELNVTALQTKGLAGVIQDLATHTDLWTSVATGADTELQAQLASVEANTEALNHWKLEMQAAGNWTAENKAAFSQQSAALKLQATDIQTAMDANIDYVEVMNTMAASTGLTVDQLAELFPNVRALRGALALAREGGEVFAQDLETIANSAGATSAAFEIQTKSWAAQFDNFKNKGTAALIGLGQVLVPLAISFLDKISPIIENLKTANPEWVKWAVGIGLVAAALGPALTLFGTLLTVLGFVISPLGLLIAAVVALGVAWTTNIGGIRDTTITMLQPIITAIGGLVTAFQASGPQIQQAGQMMLEFLQTAFATANPQIQANLQSIILSIAAFVTQASTWWSAHSAEVLAVLTFLWNLAVAVVGGGITLVTGLVAAGLQLLRGDWVGALNTLGISLETFFNLALATVGTNMTQFRATWAANLEMLGLILQMAAANILLGIQTFLANLSVSISQGILDAIAAAQAIVTGFVGIGEAIIASIQSGIANTVQGLIDQATGIANSIRDAIADALDMHSPSRVLVEMGRNAGASFAQGIGLSAHMPALAMAGATAGMISAAQGATGGGSAYYETNHITIKNEAAMALWKDRRRQDKLRRAERLMA